MPEFEKVAREGLANVPDNHFPVKGNVVQLGKLILRARKGKEGLFFLIPLRFSSLLNFHPFVALPGSASSSTPPSQLRFPPPSAKEEEEEEVSFRAPFLYSAPSFSIHRYASIWRRRGAAAIRIVTSFFLLFFLQKNETPTNKEEERRRTPTAENDEEDGDEEDGNYDTVASANLEVLSRILEEVMTCTGDLFLSETRPCLNLKGASGKKRWVI